jgi:hypothetical protein
MQNANTSPGLSNLFAKKQAQLSETTGATSSWGTPSSTTVSTARAKLQGLARDSIEFRLLDALLTHAPTIEGLDVIATDIIAASAELDGLEWLAEFYKTGLFPTLCSQ